MCVQMRAFRVAGIASGEEENLSRPSFIGSAFITDRHVFSLDVK